jgi:hypothetical protein
MFDSSILVALETLRARMYRVSMSARPVPGRIEDDVGPVPTCSVTCWAAAM